MGGVVFTFAEGSQDNLEEQSVRNLSQRIIGRHLGPAGERREERRYDFLN